MEIAGTISRESAVERINAWGRRRKPFQFLISFDGDGHLVSSPEEAMKMNFLIDMPGWNTANQTAQKEPECGNHSQPAPRPIRFEKYPVDPQQYKEAFDRVMEHIRYGNTFLLNLTFPTEVATNLSFAEIFSRSSARFKLMLKDHLVVFSPERFIRIEGTRISTNPMKGTMDASIPGSFHKLMTDPKEDAEHNTIVDLLRNDLGMVATRVKVSRFKHIEKITTHQGELLQMSSEITGILPDNFQASLGEMLFSMLPAGSICGAPKRKTLQIIQRVENYQRGFYTGIFGYFNGHELDSAVSIRYLEKQGDQMIFKSGGGITFQSQWEKEYKEMLDKVYVPFS